jgi:hypothetical protein
LGGRVRVFVPRAADMSVTSYECMSLNNSHCHHMPAGDSAHASPSPMPLLDPGQDFCRSVDAVIVNVEFRVASGTIDVTIIDVVSSVA